MSIRTVVSAAFIVSLLAGCASPTASPSASPTPEPTPSASPAPSASTTPTPTAAAVITAGPLTVAGELTFGHDNFGGVPYGQPWEGYASALGPTLQLGGCGDENFPTLWGPGLGWEIFMMVNWDDPNVAWRDWDTKAFLLVGPSGVPTTQIGPVGPRGLRLGTPEATIEAMFPAEAAISTTRTAPYPPDYDTPITERVFTIADLDGGPMIITTLDGYAATFMWGDPSYVSAARGFLRCRS